jgi:Ca2+-binding RTX toxin-like protein
MSGKVDIAAMPISRLLSVALVVAITGSVLLLQVPAEAAARCLGGRATKVGTNGNNRLEGGPGRDVIVGKGGNDLLIGFSGNDLLCGNGGDDTLVGVGGNDRLRGDAGFDVLLGVRGNDKASGGPGIDLLSFFYSRQGVKVRLGAGRASGEGRDRFSSVENVEGSRKKDRLTGSNKDNLINGAGGSDRLFGRGGSDLFLGRGGKDKINGEGGQDLASYFFSGGVEADLVSGVVTGDGRDDLAGIEALEGSRRAGDQLSGDARDNALIGEGGRDRLFGMGGNDYVEGTEGHDLVVAGGSGDDFLVGGSGNDRMGAVGTETEAGEDFLRASAGNDRLFGGAGGDLLEGGPGDDLFDGGLDFDFATFAFAKKRVRADISSGEATGWGRDTFVADPLPTMEGLQGSKHNDRLTGSSVANSLFGGRGNDELFALEDNDLLVGNAGEDDLDGGLGIDTCRTGEQKTGCELPLLGVSSGAPSPGATTRPRLAPEVVGPPGHDDVVGELLVEGAESLLHPAARLLRGGSACLLGGLPCERPEPGLVLGDRRLVGHRS